MNDVIWLSVITASIAFTITETILFKPVRTWISSKSKFCGKLINCGYCTGHWIAFVLVAIYKPRIVYFFWLLDYFLTALAIAWIAALQWIIMCYFMKLTEK